jgi:hypothetical protein
MKKMDGTSSRIASSGLIRTELKNRTGMQKKRNVALNQNSSTELKKRTGMQKEKKCSSIKTIAFSI